MGLTIIYTKGDKYLYRNGEDSRIVKEWEAIKKHVEIVDKKI